jgi:hypothetical protein
METNQRIQQLLDLKQSQSDQRLESIQMQIQKCLEEITLLHDSIPDKQEDAILRWLNFRQMSWRYDEVPLAYQKTFRWIFQRPGTEDAWEDFASHLCGSGINAPYFINGKAGSGKSTLMRFIIDDGETHAKLSQWASANQLLVLHFFFWNLGTPLQKSQVGMLRALLHKVLSQHPELTPAIFPTLYQNWKDLYADEEPSYVEVKKAFELLVNKASTFLKICIFIDGIDEFDGDHRDLSQFVRSLASENIKLIVSSRPISASVHVFQDCPTLRLQDLTKHDMSLFIKGNLVSHQSFTQMSKHFPQVAEDLVTEISTKAEGVFLWVKLVVRLLIDGLEAGDSIMDLQKKLRSLPPDLKDLYRRMLAKMLPEYQIQASEIFQLFHIWNTYTSSQPLRTLLLAFALQTPSEVLHQAVAPLDLDSYIWLLNTAEARIRSRCCGLIEVRNNHGHANAIHDWATMEEVDASVVSYLHRTVAEFLVSDDVWNETCGMTKDTGFNPFLNLSSACLSMVKCESSITRPDVKMHLENMMTFVRSATQLDDQTLRKYMNDIEETMSRHQQLYEIQMNGRVSLIGNWLPDVFQVGLLSITSAEQDTLRRVGCHLDLAARTGIIRYLRANSSFQSCDSLTKHALALHALDSWQDDPQRISLQDRTESLTFLLRGARLEDETALSRFLWRSALTIGRAMVKDKPVDCAELLRSFLTTTRNRKALMAGENIDTGSQDPWILIRELRSQRKLLADELERLVTANFHTDVSSKYLEEISDESGILSHTFERRNYRRGRRAPGTLQAPGAPMQRKFNRNSRRRNKVKAINSERRPSVFRVEIPQRTGLAQVYPYHPTTVNGQHLDRDYPHRTDDHIFGSQNHAPSPTQPQLYPSAEFSDNSSQPHFHPASSDCRIFYTGDPFQPSLGSGFRGPPGSLDARQFLSTKPAEYPCQNLQNNGAPSQYLPGAAGNGFR